MADPAAVATTQAPVASPAPDIYDPEIPLSLVAKRISVLWAGNRWYDGTVTEYNQTTDKFFIVYDDNDRRWYKLPGERTFRVVGTQLIYHAEAQESSAYRAAFVPYVSKFLNSLTNVTFHLKLDAEAVEPGEVVVVRGSLPQLGSWGAGVPLARSDRYPGVWSVRVGLPFAHEEACASGIFEYKFAIEVPGDKAVMEGGVNHRPTRCYSHFYGTFQPDSAHARRFKNAKKATGVFGEFLRQEVELLLQHGLATEFMDRLHGLRAAFPDISRTSVEDLLDALSDDPAFLASLNTTTMLAVIAAVGSFGISSAEKPKQQNNWDAYGAWSPAAPPPYPKPRKWCYWVLQNLNVEHGCMLELKTVLGANYGWVTLGAREAAERISYDGPFQWLRVVPFLETHNCLPTTWTNAKNSKKAVKDFSDFIPELRALAASAFEMAKNEPKEEKKGDVPDENKPKEAPKDPLPLFLAKSWLRALVRAAPTVQTLAALFEKEAGLQVHSSFLLPEVADWVFGADWDDTKELDVLLTLVREVPSLRGPQIGAALLRNVHSDKAKLSDSVLGLIQLCCETSGEVDFTPLESAAKEWVRRNHAHEPENKEDKSKDKEYTYSLFGGYKEPPKKKPPTKEELAKKRAEALALAVTRVDSLLRIPYFDTRSQGLLFELGRCYFLKGEPAAVLVAICGFGAKGLHTYSPHVQQFLTTRAVQLIQESVPGLDAEKLDGFVALIESNLSKASELNHILLHAVAETAGGANPSLESILRWHLLWRRVISNYQKQDGTQLTSMLQHVNALLVATATSIADSSVQLQVLHVVTRFSQPFLGLLELFKSKALSSAGLAQRVQALAAFDQTLAELKCYVTFFCNCGVPIDCQQLLKRVEDLNVRYDRLTLSEVEHHFNDLKALYGKSMAWLFRLRASAIFLALWREEGKIEAGRPEEMKSPALTPGSFFSIPSPPSSPFQLNNNVPPAPPLLSLGDIFSESKSAAVEAPQDDVLVHTLSQQRVLNSLIPTVRRVWGKLMQSVKDRSITIAELQRRFAGLKSDEEYRQELALLAQTGSEQEDKEADWVDACFQQLKDFSLLVHMQQWLPALIRVRELMSPLLATNVADDPYFAQLNALLATQKTNWDAQKLGTLSALVAPLKDQFREFSEQQLVFLTSLSECDGLVKWLLNHKSTDEFNRLLQVCRPCTDEPRLLSSIASLVQIRTLLLQLLYVKPPYQGLRDFLRNFCEGVDLGGDDAFWHLKNIQASFDGLLEVFEKQTRSPGIKSCYDVRDISQLGELVFKATADSGKVLVLELKSREEPKPGDPPLPVRVEPLEYLLDLRSKLMMTEIPEALEAEMKISSLVESFVLQLQVWCEMRDELIRLYTSGHFDYQEGYTLRLKFKSDGLKALQGELAKLKLDLLDWQSMVKAARDKHYFLNYYTMREILRFTRILNNTLNDKEAVQGPKSPVAAATSPSESKKKEAPPPPPKKAAAAPTKWTCPRCTLENGILAPECGVCDAPRPDEFTPSFAKPKEGESKQVVEEVAPPLDMLTEMVGLLHLGSSTVSAEKVITLMDDWATKHQNGKGSTGDVLYQLGNLLDGILGSQYDIRRIPLPSEKSANRADMLISVKSEERAIPVWVACAENPTKVIDVVLSVYVRRARLPAPGEILFCTSETTLEDVELLFRRFIVAQSHRRGDCVFCVADVHELTYTMQVAVVERLRGLLSEHGTTSAASLVIVSGKPRQVLLNSLSAQSIELPPLDEDALRVACQHAAMKHCGETLCVNSSINGGGKTHYIMKLVGQRQSEGERIVYRRVPIRESSTAATIVNRLSTFTRQINQDVYTNTSNAFHVDIGHIIPVSCNTLMFELLIVGVLKNKTTCQVYHRNSSDSFLLEIPNSANGVTARALRFSSLLPSHTVNVGPDETDMVRPIFTDAACTKISAPEYSELSFVCKFLRAHRQGKFRPGDTFDPDWDPWVDAEITPAECFNLINQVCPSDGAPSYLLFHNFLAFMNTAFAGMSQYPMFNAYILSQQPGLETLKDVFIGLLVETSKDFSVRNVPRGKQYTSGVASPLKGPIHPADSADLPPQFGLVRTASTEFREAAQRVEQPLVRQMSNDLATRFGKMVSWEGSEHPIVLWYYSNRGQEVDGLNILSLNPRFLDRYIRRDLKHALSMQSLNFEFDWSSLKSEQGIDILRKVEGFNLYNSRNKLKVDPIDPTYVITVDNLLKMLSIQMRLKNNLPVVIMGETGCGKSSLIRQLCAVIKAPLRTLNIHGGMEDTDIMTWMNTCIAEAHSASSSDRIVVFLDEVNTCNCMGLFKEIVCDRSMNGRPIPSNIKIIAACNPYRLKQGIGAQEENLAGLVFDHHVNVHGENVGTGITDPLKNLVYRVHPLPESMIDCVFDFGSLSPETERLYIKAMLRRQLAIYVSKEEAAGEVRKKDEKKEGPAASSSSSSSNKPPPSPVRGPEVSPEAPGRKRFGESLLRGFRRNKEPAAPTGNKPRAMTPAEIRAQAAEEEARIAQLAADEALLHAELEDGLVNEVHKGFFETRVTLTDFGEFVDVFAELICASQEFVRTLHGGERSVVSLRDVARCLRVYRWFGEHFATRKNAPWTLEDFCSVKPNATAHIRKAVILSISYCYHARLPRDHRRQFRKHVCDAWKTLQAPVREARQYAGGYGFFGQPVYGPRSTFLDLNPKEFEVVLRDVQSEFVQQMNLGEGIALNEALLENLFMILVSILNRVPIFVIGKPGSSKSLAMGLIQSNLNGDASENEFLRSLPAVEVFSYQCSPLSTSQGIEQAFEAADRYKKEAPNTIVVVLLDEVGLAEQSPHLPLKVLHKVLDEGGDTTLVGISNWALDPAKMNRAVHLYRPAPTVEDLSATAEGMVRSANLKGYLKSLAHAYSEVYLGQKRADFWGLREFYSTVRHINRELQQAKRPLDEPMIMTAVMRNFGGRPRELENVLAIFFRNLGLTLANVERVGITELVRQNLASPEARHLMLLTKNNAALGLLFDQKLLAHDKTEVIFGSDFPLDQTDLQICLNIQRVKLCMAEGITVVLVHCESLFESLYDLLNQHYTEYGGQLYVRLAFGTHSRLCPVHREFRVVVVVEKNEAYTRLAPPLLNRFEKQVMERHHLLDQEHSELVRRLKSFAFLLATDNAKAEQSEAEMQANIKSLRSSFCGYHHDMFSSLAQSVNTEDSDSESRRIEAMHRLLYIATPEAVCRVVASGRHKTLEEAHGIDVLDLYFKKQQHSDLKAFCSTALDMWSDGFGSQIVALTFSTLTSRADLALNGLPQVSTVTLTVLHELSSERDLNQSVNDFFEGCSAGSVFMLQCDPLAASIRRIEHARYVCENARARFLKKRRDANLPIPTGVHVILLVHLPRNELSYCFDFDLRWRFVFLDSLEASSQGGLPDIPSMLGHTMPEIVAGLDLHKVLLANFRTAMSRLVYLHERTNEDVRLQIMFLLNLLKTDPELIECVKGAIAEMVRRSSQSLDVMAAAQQDQTLVLAGTFQGALHRQISATVASHFALLLAHMDRNQGLYMVDANNAGARIRQIWLSLFERSIADMDLGSHVTSPFQVHEVHSDGIGLPFKARFPFSFFLIHLIESLRPSVEGLSAQKAEEQLQQQLAILGFKHGLAKRLPLSLMKRYTHDFTCMVAPHFPKLDKQTQTDILWRVLTLHSGGIAPRTLSAVHTRYWQCERTLHSYFQLIDAVQACSAPMLSRLNHSLVFGPSLDCTMVQVCLNALAPQNQGWVDSVDFSRWMGMVQLVRPTIASLLSDRGLVDVTCVEEEPEDESKAEEEVEETASEEKGESKAAEDGEEKKAPGERKTGEAVVVRAREDKRDPTSPRAPPRPPPQSAAKAAEVVVLWEKLLFAFTFIRDIAAPLKIQPSLALSTLDQLKDLELRTQATFRVIIRMFSDLNRSYSRQGQTVECDMCLQIPVNPVRFCEEANCRRLVCKRCAEDYLSSDAYLKGGQNCFWCRRPAKNYTIIQADTKLVDKSRDMEAQLQAVASRFMEFFIFEFCFGRGANSKVELTLLADFVMLLARKKLHGATEQYFIDVVPSDAARVALLRALLQLSDPSSREHVNNLILGELVASFQSFGHLDNPIALVYASVQEEMVVQSGLNNLAAAASACDGVDLSHLTNIQKSGVREVLSTIAVIRRIIVIFANALCEVVDPPSGSVSKYTFPQVEGCQQKLERIFSAKGPSPHLLRSLQMFLLKNLERGRGVSFVRSALSQPPLVRGGWLQKWKATGETGLLRFLGENKLPRHNPFKTLPFFSQIHRALTVAMAPSGSDFAPLEAALHKLMASNGNAQGGIQGALLAALFHECHLLSVLSDVAPVTKQRLDQVQQWVEKARCLDSWPPSVRQILGFFSGSPRIRFPTALNRVLLLTPQSSPEHISSVRLMAHLAAQCLNSGAGSPVLLGFFNTLIFSPELLVNTYLPVQPEDSTAMAARVLGGRWYTCPNGHAYYVDNCGRPTVIQKCATCGVDIGGTDHNLIGTNKDLDNNLAGNTEYSQVSKIKDQSAPGYCLRAAAEESNPFESARELAATSNRVVRFLLHAGMCLSFVAQGAKWPKALINTAFCTTNDPAKFFAEHVESDMQILQKMVRKSSDDLILLLHMTIVAGESAESEVSPAPAAVALANMAMAAVPAARLDARADLLARILAARRQGPGGQQVLPRPATWAVLQQSDDRQSWEAEFKRLCIDPAFGSDLKEDPVQRAAKMFSKEGEEEDGVFTSELLERLDLSTLQVEVRQVSLPALWRFRQSFNLMDFGMELSLNPANEETYPILSAFLTQESQLRALRHLTSVLEWQNLLIGKYNRSLSHSAATTMTVADVLNSVMDKSRWRAAFDGFKHAWNSSWQFVERFGCLRIPAMYKGLVITESIPIAFCMPSEKDEGICPLALVRYLGEKHNTFVERVDEVLLLRGEEVQRASSRQNVVSSKYFTQAHSLSYELQGGFASFVEKQCVRLSNLGKVEYDFANAERYLLDVVFSGKPLLDLVVRMIQYSDDVVASSVLLKQKVRQEPLPKAIQQKILREIGTPAKSHACLELLETCVSFLQATGGSAIQRLNVGDRLLGEYARSVLLLDADFGSPTVSSEVKLMHIDSLWKLLRDTSIVDPFANVRPKFKEQLDVDATLQQAFKAMGASNIEVLLPLFKDFITSYLSEDVMSAASTVKENLGFWEYQDVFLSDLPWFEQHFPATVLMKHVVALFHIMEASVAE